MLAPNAYAPAMHGVTYVIHLASPNPNRFPNITAEEWENVLVDPAVQGTMNVLEAAKAAGSLRRVVITSSIIAIVSFADFSAGKTAGTVFTGESRTRNVEKPYGSVFEAYSAGKTAALNGAEEWIKQETEEGGLGFDVVHLFPAFVLGKDEMARSAADALGSTNAFVLGPVAGGEIGYTPGCAVHVGDVARAHVRCLDERVKGNRGYLLSSDGVEGIKWEGMFDVVKREFPEAVAAGRFSNDGKILTAPVLCDASASEEALGIKFIGFEDQVKDVVEHYLELLEASI